jgi:hypothetical protein
LGAVVQEVSMTLTFYLPTLRGLRAGVHRAIKIVEMLL